MKFIGQKYMRCWNCGHQPCRLVIGWTIIVIDYFCHPASADITLYVGTGHYLCLSTALCQYLKDNFRNENDTALPIISQRVRTSRQNDSSYPDHTLVSSFSPTPISSPMWTLPCQSRFHPLSIGQSLGLMEEFPTRWNEVALRCPSCIINQFGH